MVAQLKHTVAVGRVRYPAGTTATPELRELIDPKHWSDDGDNVGSAGAEQGGRGKSVSVSIDPALAEEISELRELAAREIAARDELIKQLAEAGEAREDRIRELEAEVERLTPAADTPPPAHAAEPVDYMARTGKELKDEIDRRNADRDPADEAYVRVEPPGNKPELAAALQADDARSAG